MNVREYQVPFLVIVAVLALLVASPVLSRLLVYPRTELFTELWLLGPGHMAEDYPYNVTRGQNYTVFLGVGDRLGYCGYYRVEVKFRNQSQPVPESFGPLGNRSSSGLPSLYSIVAFVGDEMVWETPLTFSFDYAYNEGLGQVEFNSLTLNGVVLDLSGYVSGWNVTRSEFYGNLFFETWIYNGTTQGFQYHERFVGLRFNMTLS